MVYRVEFSLANVPIRIQSVWIFCPLILKSQRLEVQFVSWKITRFKAAGFSKRFN